MSIPIRLVKPGTEQTAPPAPTDTTLRDIAAQQESVAHLGHQALAGAAVSVLMEEAVACVARGLAVDLAGLFELRAESRTLLLRAGVGWQDGAVSRAVLRADGDTHEGYTLSSPSAVVIEQLKSDRRFSRTPLLAEHDVVAGITVVIPGRIHPSGVLGAYDRKPRQFTIHDSNFLQAVANVLAAAMARAQAEEALRQSEAHFRSLIDNASDIVTILGEDGIFRFASPSVQRLLGYSPSDLLERNAFEFIHVEDRPLVTETLGRAIRSPGTPQSAEFRFRHKDGTWRVLESVGQARAGVAGAAATYIVNARDITARRAQERALRANKDRLRAVVAGAPLVLFALDKEGQFTMVEGRGLESLGVRPAQLIGQSVFQVYADLPELLADFRRALAGESFSSTVEIFGQVYEVWYSPALDRNGAVTGVTGVGTDMTERRRAEEALRQSEENNRALVDHALHGICRSTPAGRFLAVNPALVKMLGYETEAELLALDLTQDLYADPTERARILDRYAAADSVYEVTEWKRKDGTRILVRLSGHAVRRTDGVIESFATMAEDITERRLLEEQLRQSQKIEALGQLTGGIAHDFNNLLTIILANAELVRHGLSTAQRHEQADLRDLISAAMRGRAMVKELLGFARRTSLNLVPLDLASVVSEVSGMLRRVLPSDIRVTIVAEPGMLPEIRGDEHAIEQILFNLVTNARDAMPGGGSLRIETGMTRMSEEQRIAAGAPAAADWVQLSVADSGFGMDEATRQRVFEPFFTTKPSGQGTGLGMATVYGLVKQLGAVIAVESAPGKGTRVSVSFPATSAARAAPRAPSASEHPVSGGHETILLVEDDDNVRRASKRVLELAGYRVVSTSDGQEALDVLRAGTPAIQLVVSDLVMPRLGGRALYDAARQGGCQVPFLFASGYSPGEGRGGVTAELGLPMLRKPWTSRDLLARVRSVLDGA